MNITMEVKGMTCKHCEKAVNDALKALQGVNTVEVYLDENKVEITYIEGEVSIPQMTEAIENQGYDVIL